ncbi:hypothetical protein [Rhodococcus erythropolis]|uniref:Uncharacterized protein n=1 Tax=Rhodococcus erythropolis TaxID=1833 RepID=A0A8I1D9Y9_RHOER|nr:hypothetical protein [Rhodococcus erythropolis]MBH5146324.1 hypothetical protein [Rhodococcus erythropolis]
MDIEHTKARISYLRTQLDVCKVHRIIPGDSTVEAAVSIAESLVAAVERVQAIAEHWSTCPKGDYDCHDCNYNRPEAGDLLLEALKLETPK